MNKIIEKNFNSINKIKFIGIGKKGSYIIDKLYREKRNIIKLDKLDINKVYKNEGMNSNFINDNQKNEEILLDLIEDKEMLLLTWDIQDIVSTQVALEIGKIALERKVIVLPIVTGYNNCRKNNFLDTKFFIKKINKNIGPAIDLSNKRTVRNFDETENEKYDFQIIEKVLDLLVENIISNCSINLDYDDIRWLLKETEDNIQMYIGSISEYDTEEDIKNSINKNMIFKRSSKLIKKIIINASVPSKQEDEDMVFRVIQSIATHLTDISHNDCKITFSINYTQKETDIIDILTVQV